MAAGHEDDDMATSHAATATCQGDGDSLLSAGADSPAAQDVPSRSTGFKHPRPPPTPNSGVPISITQNIPNNPLLPSAPASPPTPAPSPTPHQRSQNWTIPPFAVDDHMLRDLRTIFGRLDTAGKEAWLADIVESCDNHLLSYLHQLVSPRLKKDPFKVLPNELCFKVRFSDDCYSF